MNWGVCPNVCRCVCKWVIPCCPICMGTARNQAFDEVRNCNVLMAKIVVRWWWWISLFVSLECTECNRPAAVYQLYYTTRPIIMININSKVKQPVYRCVCKHHSWLCDLSQEAKQPSKQNVPISISLSVSISSQLT